MCAAITELRENPRVRIGGVVMGVATMKKMLALTFLLLIAAATPVRAQTRPFDVEVLEAKCIAAVPEKTEEAAKKFNWKPDEEIAQKYAEQLKRACKALVGSEKRGAESGTK